MYLDKYELDPVYFVSAPGLAWQACLKKTEVKLELLTDYGMILMIEKGIRGGICQATHRYAKANNKYMKDYDKNIKCLTNSFKWVEDLSKFNESFIKNYDENIDTGYFLEVDINYPKRLFNLHKDLPFLPERKKLKKSKNLFAAQKTKKDVIHIRALKQALNHGLKLKKVHRIIQFKQKAWLKIYILTQILN